MTTTLRMSAGRFAVQVRGRGGPEHHGVANRLAAAGGVGRPSGGYGDHGATDADEPHPVGRGGGRPAPPGSGVDEGRHGVGGTEGDEHGEDRAADRGAPPTSQPTRLGEHRLDRRRQHDHLVGRPLQQGRRPGAAHPASRKDGQRLGRGEGGPRRDQAGLDPRRGQAGRDRGLELVEAGVVAQHHGEALVLGEPVQAVEHGVVPGAGTAPRAPGASPRHGASRPAPGARTRRGRPPAVPWTSPSGSGPARPAPLPRPPPAGSRGARRCGRDAASASRRTR